MIIIITLVVNLIHPLLYEFQILVHLIHDASDIVPTPFLEMYMTAIGNMKHVVLGTQPDILIDHPSYLER